MRNPVRLRLRLRFPSDDRVDRAIVAVGSWVTRAVVVAVFLLLVCRVLVAEGVLR